MKKRKRTITFFSFFPAVALLATPLLLSTLAPATIDSSDWIVPQSFMTTDEILEAANVNNKEIGEVRFLDYGDSIYGGGENASSLISSSPAILDSGEVETAYVLQNPEFQRQVEEVRAQAEEAGAPMPPLLTLVALFAFAVATGTSSLKDFVKFSTYTEKVKKTIQVTKKVAKTVYRTITETVARKVKTVKQVAYTAYETNVVQVISPPSVDKLEEMARFMRKSVKENPSFSRPFERNARYYLPNMKDRSEWNNFTIEYGGIATGTRVGGTVHRLQEYFSSPAHTDVKMSLDTISDYFFEGIRFTEPALYEKLKKEFDAIVKPVIGPPVVDLTGTPYTAYRDEIETKIVYDTVTREVPETIYEDVIENHEVVEDVTKYAFTPLNEKIDLAMNYLKNYSRILQRPSNRNFADDALLPNRDLSMFAGATSVYNDLQAELKNANIYNMDRTNPEGVKEILKRHNEFIYSMKGILTKIQKGQTPEEQMTLMFGKDYTDSIRESENAIASVEADEKALSVRFEEIGEMERIGKISEGYSRTLYNSAKRNRDQLYRRKRDAIKNLKEGKEYYSRRFNGTISSLQNLSFLRSLEDWRRTLDYGQRSVASRLVPFTTASGSVIYRKPIAPTTTQAQPKKTLQKSPPANPTASASPADLKTASLWSKIKGWFWKDAKVDTAKTATPQLTMATITADNLNVRSGPDTSYAQITQLNTGDKVEIIGKSPDEKWLKIKLEGITGETWIINNNDWVKAPSLKDVEVVKIPKKTINTNLNPDKLTNIILTSVAQNFPLENPSQRYLYLGSGYHDGNEYYSVDLNHVDGGDSDRGHPVKAVSSGVIRIGNYVNLDVDLKHGAVTIDHQEEIDKEKVPWQSGYLHMPLFATGTKEKVDVLVDGKVVQEEREIYEMRNTKKIVNEKGEEETITETVKLWDGKNVATGEQIGFVGGRQGVKKDGSYNEMIDNAHLHFFAKMDERAVDLRTALFEAGLRTVKAYDGGPDDNWLTLDNASLYVKWNDALQSWVNNNEKLVLDRRPQEVNTTGAGLAQSWLAWEDGKTVGEMGKVVWETQKEKGYEKGIARWRESGNPGSFWEPSERKFKPVEIIK